MEREPSYFIDVSWFEENSRSFALIAQSRMCPSCRGRIGTEHQERVPVVDAQSGRVVFEVRQVPYGSNPLVIIRDCCSKAKGYITPEMPILEVIFRLFLANANQPLGLSDLYERLKEWMVSVGSSRDISPEVLKRLLDHDHYYGLRRFGLPEEETD